MSKFDTIALAIMLACAGLVAGKVHADAPNACQARVTVVVDSEYGSDPETTTFVSYWLCRGNARPNAQGAVRLCTLSKSTGTTVWANALDVDIISAICPK